MRQLPAVVVADHVVGEDDEALTREIDGARRHRVDLGVLEAAVRPVAVRREDRRKRSAADWAIEVAGDVEAGQALEVDLRDGVIRMTPLVEDLRTQWRLLWRRQQTGGGEDVLAQVV